MSLLWRHHHRRPYFQFAILTELPGVVHGVFPRFGWDGQGRRVSVSYGRGCPADPHGAQENRRLMAQAVGAEAVVFTRQVHGATVGIWQAPSDTVGSGAAESYCISDTDALISAASGYALGILTADCQSVLMVDPVRRVVANVHSGWRGSVQNIVGGAVKSMQATYGCRPADIRAAIAPSLGPCCAQYVDYRRNFPQSFWRYRLPDDRFDFWRMTHDQLTESGVSAQYVMHSGMCTRCNQHLFYSYRGDRTEGRCATIIGLQN